MNTVTSPTGSCGNVARRDVHPRVDGVGGPGVGDHRQRHGQCLDPRRDLRQHRDRERVSANDPVLANNTVNNNKTARNTADLAVTKTDGVAW